MRIFLFVSWVVLLSWPISNSSSATSISTTTVEQPVNLGAKSDPARIPLGRVGVLSNYDYGIHRMIGEAQDPTQIRAFPITLRVKSRKPPRYSPYTKDQVLAATLCCLLRSAGGTPENPLDVRVLAEGLSDKPLEGKYSGKYVTRPGKDGKDPFIPLTPGMIILQAGGDGDVGWHILPIWGNGDDPSDPHNVTLECQFVWDAAAHKLTKGFVPLVKPQRRSWITSDPPKAAE